MSGLEALKKELYEYLPPLTKREDFDQFWQDTLKQAASVELNPKREDYDYPSDHVKAYTISYNGFDDTRIQGLYLVPSFLKKEKYPCMIHYHGYGGGMGIPSDFMAWVNLGMAVLSVDCRDQGGATGNSGKYSSGWLGNAAVKGILDKNEYYFRGVYMDCVKAIDFAETCREIDKDRIIVAGGSQGGALAMAVSCLDHRPRYALADIPSNSNLEKMVEESRSTFGRVTDFLRRYPEYLEQAYDTLSYFDTMNMADKIQCEIFACVALMDDVCPAKYYFASYNRIQAPKHMTIYPFNGHDGTGPLHIEKKLRFVKESGILED
ncbi:cephalosporin-C deacetylase [Anaerotaenia torta]|uniref:acetylxylan esterase n=1 Tax=Anaerotaenia torta TaxID=433293 RepID=UPI003D1CAAF6